MTEGKASHSLKRMFEKLQVSRGQTIYLGLDMARLPLPTWPVPLNRDAIRAREARWCAFLFENLMDVLGPNGTLLVGTFSYSCSNPEVTFVLEETPSEIGPFTNWFRQHPQSIRSLHPIFSVAGVGRHAIDILKNTGGAAFGPCSPFGRLVTHNARFVNLGVPLKQTLTYVHHLEQCYGCCHRYHKVFHGSVMQNGKKVDQEFIGYMRWRGVDAGINLEPLEKALKGVDVLAEINEPGLYGQSVLAVDVDRIGYQLLSKDSLAFSAPKIRIDIDDSQVASKPSLSPIITFKLLP